MYNPASPALVRGIFMNKAIDVDQGPSLRGGRGDMLPQLLDKGDISFVPSIFCDKK